MSYRRDGGHPVPIFAVSPRPKEPTVAFTVSDLDRPKP